MAERTGPPDLKGALRFGPGDVDGSIIDRLRCVATAGPDRPALADPEGNRVTYGELVRSVEDRAHWLQAELGNDTRPVALLMPHDPVAVVSELAVIATGRGVVPLDPTVPDPYLTDVLADSTASALIASSDLEEHAMLLGAEEVLKWDSWPGSQSSSATLPTVSGRSPAFLLYTSGTTGAPKGVMSNHRAFLSGARELARAEVFRPSDRVAMVVPLSFAAGACQTLWPLLAGAEVVLFPLRTSGIPAFTEWLRGADIHALSGVPTLLRAISNLLSHDPLEQLRTLVVGGEAVRGSDIPLMRAMSARSLDVVPVYASTELMLVSWHVVRADVVVDDPGPLHIGTPVEGRTLELEVLDEAEVLGELVVETPVVSSGYWRRPELSSECVEIDENTDRMRVHTGDLARNTPSGIQIVGRTDSMVKVRGNRVELGAVERALLEAPGVVAATVSVEPKGTDRRLVGHVALKDGTDIDSVSVRSYLRARLPGFMVPSRVVVHDQLPTLATGKVDRARLAEAADAIGGARLEPGTTIESDLLERLARIIDIDGLGLHDDLDDLEIDSLALVELLVFIEEEYGVRVPVSAFLDFATLADVADHVERASGGTPGVADRLVLIQAGVSDHPPLLIAHDLHGSAYRFRNLARAVGEDQPCWGMDSPLLTGRAAVDLSLEGLARHQLRLLRDQFPAGPYHLLGYSFGTLLVTEMAAQLEQLGEEVGFVGLVDFGPVHVRHRTRRREGPRPPGGWPERAPSDLPAHRRLAHHLSRLRALAPEERSTYLSRVLDAGRAHDMWLARRDIDRRGMVRPSLRTAWNWYCEMEMAFDFQFPQLRSAASLFLSDQTAKGKMDVSRRLDFASATTRTLGWEAVYEGGVNVVDVVGHHNDLVEEPYVSEVGATVRESFDAWLAAELPVEPGR